MWECHLCQVVGNTVIPYGMWVPVAVTLVANCYNPFTLLYLQRTIKLYGMELTREPVWHNSSDSVRGIWARWGVTQCAPPTVQWCLRHHSDPAPSSWDSSSTAEERLPRTQRPCCSTDSKRPHRRCHLLNKAENIDRMLGIPYTLQWARKCPYQNCPFLWEIRAPTYYMVPPAHPSISQTASQLCSQFCRAHRYDHQTHTQLHRPRYPVAGIYSGSWYHCLPIRTFNWLWQESCTTVVCETVCCMKVRPGL